MTSVGFGRGKVILLGEHAVVYGHPALAAALDCGVTVRARASDALSLRVPAWGIAIDARDDHPVAVALRAVADAIGTGETAAALEAEAAIPPAAGLGSSAALAVALTRALAAHLGHNIDDDGVARAADAAERCFHRTPSGVDVALATRGGVGVFRRGHGLTPLTCPRVSLVIGMSGEPRSTATMVERVAAAVRGDGSDARLTALGEAAARGAALLTAGDLDGLGPLLTSAHRTLASLGVSSPPLDAMVDTALAAGAIGAKLTGAGGGGAVIALAPGGEDAVLDAWRRLGKDGFVAALHG